MNWIELLVCFFFHWKTGRDDDDRHHHHRAADFLTSHRRTSCAVITLWWSFFNKKLLSSVETMNNCLFYRCETAQQWRCRWQFTFTLYISQSEKGKERMSDRVRYADPDRWMVSVFQIVCIFFESTIRLCHLLLLPLLLSTINFKYF